MGRPERDVGQARRMAPPIHQGVVLSCAFLGEPSALATASVEGAIVIWDVDAGRPVRCVSAHRGPVPTMTWDARRRRLISGGQDRRVLACDPEGRVLELVKDLPAGVHALAISPDGEVLASGGSDGAIRLWRAADGAALAVIAAHDGAVLDLDFVDDTRLASVGRDYQVIVWDVRTRTEALRTAGHRRWSMRVRASADGRELYSAGEDGQVCGWSAETGARLWRRQLPSPVWGLERSADGSTLVVGAGGLAARIDLGPDGPSAPQPIASETARAIARSDAGLMALGADTVMLYRTDAPGQSWRRLPLGAPLYASIAAAGLPAQPESIAAVMTRSSGEVDLEISGQRRTLTPSHRGIAFASCFVAPSTFATTGFDGMIHLRDADDGAIARSLSHDGFIFSISSSADGARLLAVGNDAMSLWDTATGERIWAAKDLGVGFHVWGTLAADASFAIAVGEGPTLHRWDFAAGKARRQAISLDFGRLIGTCGLMAVALLDEASAAVATAAGEVRRVDLATGRSVALHAGHEAGVRAMAVSPDRRRLLSFCERSVVRLCDLQAGTLCTPAAMDSAVVPAACFTPSGDLVWVDGVGVLHLADG